MTYPEKSIFPPIKIYSKEKVFDIWSQEKKRFFQLFKNIDNETYHEKCRTSSCGHTFGEHIFCLLVWMEAAVKFFQSILDGQPKDIRDFDLTMLEWTNREIDRVRSIKLIDIWDKLEREDLMLQSIIKSLDDKFIFTERNNEWTWLVWTTFGHYDVHSTELEFQKTGKQQTGLEKKWLLNINNQSD